MFFLLSFPYHLILYIFRKIEKLIIFESNALCLNLLVWKIDSLKFYYMLDLLGCPKKLLLSTFYCYYCFLYRFLLMLFIVSSSFSDSFHFMEKNLFFLIFSGIFLIFPSTYYFNQSRVVYFLLLDIM